MLYGCHLPFIDMALDKPRGPDDQQSFYQYVMDPASGQASMREVRCVTGCVYFCARGRARVCVLCYQIDRKLTCICAYLLSSMLLVNLARCRSCVAIK